MIYSKQTLKNDSPSKYNQYPQSFLPYLSLYIFSSFQIDHKVKKVEFMQVKFGKNPGSGGMIGGG